MRIIWSSLLMLLTVAANIHVAQAATYIPIAANNPQSKASSKLSASTFRFTAANLAGHADMLQSGNLFQPSPATFPVCNPIPKVADLSGVLQYHQALLSTDTAIQLGFLSATVNVNANSMILVRDYSKSVQCLATDQKTELSYGQSIRTVITIDDYDSKLGLSLASIAASATLSGKNDQVTIGVLGFDNTAFPPIFASIANQELNVDTYSKYADVESQLIKLTTDPATKLSVARLGIVQNDQSVELENNVVVAYALQEIANGRSCSYAKSNISNITNDVAADITSTYMLVDDACDSNDPSDTARASAKSDLMGFTVRY